MYPMQASTRHAHEYDEHKRHDDGYKSVKLRIIIGSRRSGRDTGVASGTYIVDSGCLVFSTVQESCLSRESK